MSFHKFSGRLTTAMIALFCSMGLVSSVASQTAPVVQPTIQSPTRAASGIRVPPVNSKMRAIPPIRITTDIPSPPPEMEVFKLAPTRAPMQFLDEKLKVAGLPALKLDQKNYLVRMPATGDKDGGLRAFIDLQSGDTVFIPNMGELVRTAARTKPMAADRIAVVAKAIYADPRFIPKDATQWRLAEVIPVLGSEAGKPARGGTTAGKPPLDVMTLVPAVRYAAGLPVYGIGSHSVVTFDAAGTMVGAIRRWRTASPGERIKTRITPDQIHKEILRQLQPLVATRGTTAIVDKIELAYYDNNQNFLEPVYHFEATVQPANKRVAAIRASGFIPVGPSREPIPDLAAKPQGEMPTVTKQENLKLLSGGIGKSLTASTITLGEYANRDWHNDSGYVSMSNSFLSGLTFLNSLVPGLTPVVTRTQWVEAWPWEVVGPSSKYYMNAVNVAYTVPHGDWLINTTLRNNADTWYVPDIGTNGNPGYGAATGGKLATWVIMSCEVIPSYYDRLHEAGGSGNGYDAFNAWWPVFQGMHNAIGFRTIMFYPDTSLQWGFGYAASLGGDLNAAWFQEVAANEGGSGTYQSQHLAGAPMVHYDRASTMIDGRNLGQSIFAVGPQSASSSLWSFWMGN